MTQFFCFFKKRQPNLGNVAIILEKQVVPVFTTMETKIKMIVYKLERKFGTYAKLLNCSFHFYEKMEMSYFA